MRERDISREVQEEFIEAARLPSGSYIGVGGVEDLVVNQDGDIRHVYGEEYRGPRVINRIGLGVDYNRF